MSEDDIAVWLAENILGWEPGTYQGQAGYWRPHGFSTHCPLNKDLIDDVHAALTVRESKQALEQSDD